MDLNRLDERLKTIEERLKDPDEPISIQEAAELLGVTEAHMYVLVADTKRFKGRRIPSYKFRGRRFIKAKDIKEYAGPSYHE